MFSETTLTTLSPHTQQPLLTREYPSQSTIDAALARAVKAQESWRAVPVQDRIALGRKFGEEFKALSDSGILAKELTMQMGRPISQCAGEARGMLGRTDYMLDIAAKSLSDVDLKDTDQPGFRRYIKRMPLGVVLVVAPWNFPYLVTINSVLPAIIAGNSVILKPSPQTPLTAERFAEAWTKAGLPDGVLQVLHLNPAQTEGLVARPEINFVSFTGSVKVGKRVEEVAVKAAQTGFLKGVGLELGGKDPAYVRFDADLDYTVAELVDGAFFNSGQSCCAVERIYVHSSLYDDFVARFIKAIDGYVLGNPEDSKTNLGPVVSIASADRIKEQIKRAIAKGAKALIDEGRFKDVAKPGTAFVAPQVLVNVDHSMDIMTEESFGPVIGIMSVSGDEEALKLMNDSPYGLTASVWTKDHEGAVFDKFVDELQTGTVFLNRCDYLDPALAWTGVKDSGRGVSLSKFGYDQLTRPKSVHKKMKY